MKLSKKNQKIVEYFKEISLPNINETPDEYFENLINDFNKMTPSEKMKFYKLFTVGLTFDKNESFIIHLPSTTVNEPDIAYVVIENNLAYQTLAKYISNQPNLKILGILKPLLCKSSIKPRPVKVSLDYIENEILLVFEFNNFLKGEKSVARSFLKDTLKQDIEGSFEGLTYYDYEWSENND